MIASVFFLELIIFAITHQGMNMQETNITAVEIYVNIILMIYTVKEVARKFTTKPSNINAMQMPIRTLFFLLIRLPFRLKLYPQTIISRKNAKFNKDFNLCVENVEICGIIYIV